MAASLRIAVLGNNRLALPALQALVASGQVCALGTTAKFAEVKHQFKAMAAAGKLPLTVFRRPGFEGQLTAWLTEHQPDVVFVMTFPWRIPETVLEYPRHGFLNVHYGLLPEMRGQDPIFECIRRQWPETGVTFHRMDRHFDSGPILLQAKVPVPPFWTYGMLTTQLAFTGAELCRQVLPLLTEETLPGIPQDESKARYWPAPQAHELYINWQTMPRNAVLAHIRAFNPLQKGAPVLLNNWTFGITEASASDLPCGEHTPGTILKLEAGSGLHICCAGREAIHVEVIYTEEGFFPGHKLAQFGIRAGMQCSGLAFAPEPASA